MGGPRITTGKDSKQDYRTPADFMAAVVGRFGPIAFDLAATAANSQHPRFYSPIPDPLAVGVDALAQDWSRATPGGLLWLNPPFSNVEPWAKKCEMEASHGARIAFLVNAAVGSNWARTYVLPCAETYLLNGRLCFDGKNVFPKDCMLALYGTRRTPMIRLWEWKKDIIHASFKRFQ